jgi:hypothetical protein
MVIHMQVSANHSIVATLIFFKICYSKTSQFAFSIQAFLKFLKVCMVDMSLLLIITSFVLGVGIFFSILQGRWTGLWFK